MFIKIYYLSNFVRFKDPSKKNMPTYDRNNTKIFFNTVKKVNTFMFVGFSKKISIQFLVVFKVVGKTTYSIYLFNLFLVLIHILYANLPNQELLFCEKICIY